MHIVTVITHSENYFPYLVESCKRNGSELIILGYGEKWLGFNWKYKKIIEYLNTLPKNDIVCCIDGYDVICTRNLNELESEFIALKEKTKCKIVVGHDKHFFLNKIASIYFGKCKKKSLNAGTYIGYAGDMLEIIEKIYNLNPKNDADDQILMTKYCNLTNEFYIDDDNKLFLTILYSLYDLDKVVSYQNNKLSYQSNFPFFIHAPGYGILDTIIEKLHYGKCNIRYKLYKEFFKKKFLLYFREIFPYIILIIFVTFIMYICSNKKIIKLITRKRRQTKFNLSK